MIISIGEILFDIFPGYRQIGGAPFNFAFHLKKLGFDIRFISKVGQDKMGDDILSFLDSHYFDTADIQIDTRLPTGFVDIQMDDNGGHDFEIIRPVAYDCIEFDHRIQSYLSATPDLIYFGSLIQRNSVSRDTIQKILSVKPKNTRTFCDINLRKDCWTRQTLNYCLKMADILKLNHEELEILNMVENVPRNYSDMVNELKTGFNIKTVILTLGDQGSLWHSLTDEIPSGPVSPSGKIIDTVGAGDAYSAMAMACYLKGLDTKRTLNYASLFAGRICCIEGALPETDNFYDEFIEILGS